MTVVRLSWPEVYRAAQLGCRRNCKAHQAARRPAFVPPHDPDLWLAHIGGLIGEMVVAKWLGILDTWEAETEKPDTEVGDVLGLQVRYTPHAAGCLIIYKKDPTEHTYMLVTGRLPEDGSDPAYTVRGWLTAAEARLRGRWHRGAWWVEQADLWPVEQLPRAA